MSPYGHPNHKPGSDGRTRRELTPLESAHWSHWTRERRRIKDRNANFLGILISVLLLLVIASLAAITSSKAHAQPSAWGTLPVTALRLCFVDDGEFDCLYRVSDFDTLRFCPGTGIALHQPSPPGLLMVGFTDAFTSEFTVVRTQAYQWRQLQEYEGRIVIGLGPDVIGSFADGFEDCDEYRT